MPGDNVFGNGGWGDGGCQYDVDDDSLEHMRRCRVINGIAAGLEIITNRALDSSGSWYSVYKSKRARFCLPYWQVHRKGKKGGIGTIAGAPASALTQGRERSLAYFVASIYDIHNSLRARGKILSTVDQGVRKCRALFKEYGRGRKKERKIANKARKKDSSRPGVGFAGF